MPSSFDGIVAWRGRKPCCTHAFVIELQMFAAYTCAMTSEVRAHEEAQQGAEALRSRINAANYRYYVLDDPEISDGEWDALMRELRDLEARFPDLITLESPTQHFTGAPLDKFPTVRHPVPML